MPSGWGRTLRTVAHLRPVQLAHRLRYRVRRALWERQSGRVDERYRARAAQLPALRWDHPGLARVAAWRAEGRDEAADIGTADGALLGRFGFLGRSEDLGREVDWFRPDLDAGTRLWKTHLHEFSYAEALARVAALRGGDRYRERFFELARSWRAAAPIGCPDFALDAWNARAVATRLLHWAVAGSLLGLRPDDPDAGWLGREIGLHGLFLRDNLELDLGGNHLFRDAVGLVFAQELVGGIPDALEWLERVASEQLLPDGAHEERAPLYHAICTRDLLECRLLLGSRAPAWLSEALARAAGFLAAIRLGDGEIPLLGDAWLGEVDAGRVVASARELVDPIEPAAPERHSGLVPLEAGPWRLVVRAGAHAPDEQMGHAHADLLSFDASRGATRVVTDTGTLLYDPGPDRQRTRNTAAHNTIRLDDSEQLEAWGSFRVGQRGRARAQARGRTGTGGSLGTWEWLAASHDAYRRLPGRPVHHRLIAVAPSGILVLDAVLGAGRHRIESHVHEHPAAEPARVRFVALQGSVASESAPLHERFGETRPMRRHRTVTEAELPWLGGWWIAPDASAGGFGAPRLEGDLVHFRLDAEVALTWNLRGTDPVGTLSLCSVSDGSAT